MRTILTLTTIIIIGLVISCTPDKKIKNTLEINDRIIDNSYILTQPQKDSIFELIKNLDQEIGSQIFVLTVDTMGPEKIEEFSLRMTEKLKTGRASHNDGLLITLVVWEREARIEVGTGLENIIKDEIAGRVMQDIMIPKFRHEKYGLGIYLAVEKMSKLIKDNKELVGTEPK